MSDMGSNNLLTSAFDILNKEAKGLYLGETLPELFSLPTSLEFTRDFVAKNLPVVIRGATAHWSACQKWNSNYFRETLTDKSVQVAVTANGYADGIAVKMPENKEYFVMPDEQTMSMAQFLDQLDRRDTSQICYIQKQNSNLSLNFHELHNDIDMNTLEFARDAFNKPPDAINFWMGDERAITSMHKDPYENIYTVISGYKDFILIPPIDLPYVPRSKYPSATYKTNEHGELIIDPLLDGMGNEIDIEWVSIDPLQPDLTKYPNYSKATAFELRLNAGDILYLPSLWYHHVRQSHKCIAVNFCMIWITMQDTVIIK